MWWPEIPSQNIIPTTFGALLEPPFNDATLFQDGPGDETFDLTTLALVPILDTAEPDYLSMGDAVRRGRSDPRNNWGQRLASKLCKEVNWGKISVAVWQVDISVVFPKTVWRGPRGGYCAGYVVRHEHGFYPGFQWFSQNIYRNSRFARCNF